LETPASPNALRKKMNKLFSLLALAGVLMTGNAMAQATYVEDVNYQGKHFGIRTNDSLAFFGATPVHRQTGVTLSGIGAATIKSNVLKAASTQVALTQYKENQTNLLKAATTQVTLTMQKSNMVFLAITAANTTGEVTLAVVTNVTVSTVWGFASTTAGVVTNEGSTLVVTNVAVNTVWGLASTTAGVATNEVIGAVDGNASMTNIVNALRNLGLAGDN
jgi:hypothetical protein